MLTHENQDWLRLHVINTISSKFYNGVIEMIFGPTTEMIADGLTKAVGKEKFKKFVQALNIAN